MSRPQTALERRAQQLQRWREHDTNESIASRDAARVRFSPRAMFFAAIAEKDFADADSLLQQHVTVDVRNNDGLTALHQAAIDDSLESVDFLVTRGADPNATDNEGWTPLHAAASCGHLTIVERLLEAGADVTRVNNDGELPVDIADCDTIEERLLCENAVQLRRSELSAIERDVQQWLSQGKVTECVDPRTRATVLHVCAAKGYNEILRQLLKPPLIDSIDINARDSEGWTPLHAACHWGQNESVDLLLSVSVRTDLKTNNGSTAADLSGDSPAIVELLRHAPPQQQPQQQSETERRVHAKRVRETRRSTQGIRTEDVQTAIKEIARACPECERLRSRVSALEQEKREWNREKRGLSRRISELEEEVKSLESLRNDNLRLKDENGALIRVISKLSK